VTCPDGIRPGVPAAQAPPGQEPGRKPARPLPYQLDGSAAMGPDGRLRIALSNAGAQAAPVAVHANPPCADGPWPLEVAAGGTASASFSPAGPGLYDFTCYGPNGFCRRFAGGADGRLEAASRIDPGDLSLLLLLRNRGPAPVAFTVKAGGEPAELRRRVVPPGASCTETFHPLARGQGWYDLTVTADADTRFLRVLAGHLENGQDSVTYSAR